MTIRVIALLVALGAGAEAQVVRGAARDAFDRRPLDAAAVQLLDQRGLVVRSAITADSEEFAFTLPAAGTYRIRARRIGYRPATSDSFSVAAGETATRSLELQRLTITLDTMRVQARNPCRQHAGAGAAAELWDQARAALTVAQITADDRRLSVSVLAWERELHPRTRAIVRERVFPRGGFTSRPFASVSADRLSREGYVQRTGDGGMLFHGPDLDVLASDRFLAEHCLRLGARSGDEVSIAFEPTGDRRVADIRGLAWLEWPSLELRRVEFQYTNLSRAYMNGGAGGLLQFTRVPKLWAVARWELRMPLLEVDADFARQSEERVVGIRVQGGQLVQVRRGGDTLWAMAATPVRMLVQDSASRAPLPGVAVNVAATAITAVSDAAGRVSLALLPGVYEVTVFTPEMRSIGAWHRAQLTVTEVAQRAPVVVRVPSLDYSLERLCPNLGERQGVVAGVVSAGSAVRAGARVQVSWEVLSLRQDATGVTSTPSRQFAEATSDAQGRFTVCGVPRATALRVTLPQAPGVSASARLEGDARLTQVELVAPW